MLRGEGGGGRVFKAQCDQVLAVTSRGWEVNQGRAVINEVR